MSSEIMVFAFLNNFSSQYIYFSFLEKKSMYLNKFKIMIVNTLFSIIYNMFILESCLT